MKIDGKDDRPAARMSSPLTHGYLIIEHPAHVTREDYEDTRDLVDIWLRGLERRAAADAKVAEIERRNESDDG